MCYELSGIHYVCMLTTQTKNFNEDFAVLLRQPAIQQKHHNQTGYDVFASAYTF